MAVGPVRGVSAVAGLCPRGLGGLTSSPLLQTEGEGETH